MRQRRISKVRKFKIKIKLCLKEQNYSKALEIISRGLKIDPTNISLHEMAILIHLTEENWDACMLVSSNLKKMYGNNVKVFKILGNVHFRIHDYETSCAYYQKARDLLKDDIDKSIFEMWYLAAINANKLTEIINFHSENAHRFNTKFMEIIYLEVLVRKGKFETAYQICENIFKTWGFHIKCYRFYVILGKILDKYDEKTYVAKFKDISPDQKYELLLYHGKTCELESILKQFDTDDKHLYLRQIRFLIAKEAYNIAFNCLLNDGPKGLANQTYYTYLLMTALYSLKLPDVEGIFNKYKGMFPTKKNFRYLFFQYYATIGNFDKAFSLYYLSRPSHFLDRKYNKRWEALQKNFKEEKAVVLSVGGPGDELRFSSFYKTFLNTFRKDSLIITCEPRLESILKRSFPEITFYPLQRFRLENPFDTYSSRDKVASKELASICDNSLLSHVQTSQKIYQVTELIHKLHKIHSIENEALIKVDPNLDLYWKNFLSDRSKKNVGLSWRSGLLSNARNHHYLTLKEASQLFKQKDIKFYVLQYELHLSEIEILKQYANVEIITNLDQKDDFENTAAFIKNLDLVISPCTTTAELSGALGKSTWMFSNSPMNNYRRKQDRDLWRNSVEILSTDSYNSKKNLVANLNMRLTKWLNSFNL